MKLNKFTLSIVLLSMQAAHSQEMLTQKISTSYGDYEALENDATQSLTEAWENHLDGDVYTMSADHLGIISKDALADRFTINGDAGNGEKYRVTCDKDAERNCAIEVAGGGQLTLKNIIFENFIHHPIFNYDGGVIESIEAVEFINNSSPMGRPGGAIFNASKIKEMVNVIFQGNISPMQPGGAIVNTQEDAWIGLIKNAIFDGNESGHAGGAIYNGTGSPIGGGTDSATIENIVDSSFVNNRARYGGAITNTDSSLIVNIINSQFKNNEAEIGGAIYNDENDVIENIEGCLFENNIASNEAAAIYNAGTLTIKDCVFMNNKSTSDAALSGAIYNDGTMKIAAINGNTCFTGNSAKGISNAIYNAGTLSLAAASERSIIFNDRINGEDGLMHINKPSDAKQFTSSPLNGTIIFNNLVSNHTINLYKGTIKTGFVKNEKGEIISYGDFDSSVTLNVEGGAIDHCDGDIRAMNVGSLNLNKSADIHLDADLAQKDTTDRIDSHNPENVTVANGAKFNVKKINILSDGDALITRAHFTDNENLKTAINLSSREELKGYAPIFKYDVSFDSASGDFIFARTEEFNSAILVTPAAAQIGAYMTQVNSFEQAFSNYDLISSLNQKQRHALYNQRAKTSQGNFWVRPYSSKGDINYSNIPNVDEFTYGTYAGVDSAVKDIPNGWSSIYSAYAGYNGSEQKFDGAKVQQNGGIAGVSALAYKKNFWTSLTLNVGALSADADTMYGEENFNMLTSGVASKSGYNVELDDGNYILQPHMQVSYSYVGTEDYNNASGVRIKADDMHAFQIVPGVRFISNRSKEWQPYLDVRMIWNLNDKSSFKADNHALPNLSIDPYVEYGAGMQWHYSENTRFHGSIMMRSGGRRGGSFNLGMSWSL